MRNLNHSFRKRKKFNLIVSTHVLVISRFELTISIFPHFLRPSLSVTYRKLKLFKIIIPLYFCFAFFSFTNWISWETNQISNIYLNINNCIIIKLITIRSCISRLLQYGKNKQTNKKEIALWYLTLESYSATVWDVSKSNKCSPLKLDHLDGNWLSSWYWNYTSHSHRNGNLNVKHVILKRKITFRYIFFQCYILSLIFLFRIYYTFKWISHFACSSFNQYLVICVITFSMSNYIFLFYVSFYW